MTSNCQPYPLVANLYSSAEGWVDILKFPHFIEEKLEGLHISFGMFGGELKARSSVDELNVNSNETVFTRAFYAIKARMHLLKVNWTYRAIFITGSSTYTRMPNGGLVLFDINDAGGGWLSPIEKRGEAFKIGLECVPLVYNDYKGGQTTCDDVSRQLKRISMLGGRKVAGVIIKQFGENNPLPMCRKGLYYGASTTPLIAKFPQEEDQKAVVANPPVYPTKLIPRGDIIELLSGYYSGPRRWSATIDRLKKTGSLENTPTDIGEIMKAIPEDIRFAYKEEIKELLFTWAWPNLRKKVTVGFPEYYKAQIGQEKPHGC